MSIQILKNELKQDILRNIYVLYGEEEYLENYYLKRIINKINIKNQEFNLIEHDGKELTEQVFADTIDICPLFSEKKVYVVSNLPVTNIGVIDFLKTNFDEIPEHTILIITLENTLSSYKDTFKNLDKVHGLSVEFILGNENELVEWVSRHFKSKGHFADNKTIKYMLSICDNKMSSLKNEIDKLSNFCINEEITRKEIDKVITKSLDTKVFELTNAILNGGYDKSFILLNNLLKLNFDEIIIASSIYQVFIKLSYVKVSLKSKISKSTVLKDLAMKEYPYKLNVVLANKLSEKFIFDCLKKCSESDKLLKRYNINKRFVLYKLIGDIFLVESKQNAKN